MTLYDDCDTVTHRVTKPIAKLLVDAKSTSMAVSPAAGKPPKRKWQSKKNRLAKKERLNSFGDRDARLLHQASDE